MSGWSRVQSYFNPRSRGGSDYQCLKPVFTFYNFNPRSCVGSDHTVKEVHHSAEISTRAPRGERRAGNGFAPCTNWLFQSTLPRGERHGICPELLMAMIISIHAPTWGATLYQLQHGQSRLILIRTTARGATASTLPSFLFHRISIHAPT